MPTTTTYIEPDVALIHGGVVVFHTYKDDDYDSCRYEYWFTTSPIDGDGSDEAFDVRDLDVPSAKRLTSDRPAFIRSGDEEAVAAWIEWNDEGQLLIATALRDAIDAKLIPPREGVEVEAWRDRGATYA